MIKSSHLKKDNTEKNTTKKKNTFQLIKKQVPWKKNLPGLVGEQLTQELAQIFT